MFGVKSFFHRNDKKTYHRKKKFLKRYDKIDYAQSPGQNYDIRLIVVRHAERVDLAFGTNWYEQVFGDVPSASPQSYSHPMLPQRLPRRSNTLLYVFDPPITRSGEQASFARGQQLARLGASADYCYSSPASRCVLTANALLKGMTRSQVPISLEPYLFEPMSWNTHLQELGNISPFMSSGDWMQSGYNIDRRYRRLNDYLSPAETENDYMMRSGIFFESIERRHSIMQRPGGYGNPYGRRSTILIVGHAASPVIFPTLALDQPFDAQVFGEQCGHIPFLHTIVLERNATNHQWHTRPIVPFVKKL